MVEHGFLVLAADAAEVAQEAAAAGHHLGEGDLLQTRTRAGGADQLSVSGKRVRKNLTLYKKACNNHVVDALTQFYIKFTISIFLSPLGGAAEHTA